MKCSFRDAVTAYIFCINKNVRYYTVFNAGRTLNFTEVSQIGRAILTGM
jgi:hypothetical protein